MADEQQEIHAETDAARAGSTPHIVRWILILSLFAAIAALSLIWITGAATRNPGPQNVEYSHQEQVSQADGAATGSSAEPGSESASPTLNVENTPESAPSPTPVAAN